LQERIDRLRKKSPVKKESKSTHERLATGIESLFIAYIFPQLTSVNSIFSFHGILWTIE
jgi:hypothetical protein